MNARNTHFFKFPNHSIPVLDSVCIIHYRLSEPLDIFVLRSWLDNFRPGTIIRPGDCPCSKQSGR